MTRRDPVVALRHMLGHAREAHSLVEGRSREELEADRLLSLSLTRLVEVTGEAATRVPSQVRDRHPQVRWAQIIAMRNRLIHGYDVLDLDVLWQTVTDDVPRLVTDLERVLAVEE